ncbi:hypothetical protein ACFOLJ_07095 [Rugamonas sp. CCM 8940]|uniref:hypothetical protein n=1 Tax=Rugamonas sp. CCM 8940 TaxID=2765359 RepID=UPI0018F3227D|nr:hypothetical protein [Rugamonas sp. CCM 8940]MBJ7310283.1 hypothetical protein [Rugamonas sp. CCM 8940]
MKALLTGVDKGLADLNAHVSVIQSNYATKEYLANVRTDIAKLEVTMLRCAAATILAVAGMGISLLVSILKLAH